MRLQIDSIVSLFCSKNILKIYTINNIKDLKTSESIKALLLNYRFWNDLENVKKILQLIYEQQKISESNRVYLDYVITR